MVVQEIHARDTVGEEIEHAHRDESAVEAVALVETAESLPAGVCVAVEWRIAEEALEAGFADIGVAFVVDVALVIVEEGEFLVGTGVWLEGDFELVVWSDVGFQARYLAFVDGGEEVEGIVGLLLLPVSHISMGMF